MLPSTNLGKDVLQAVDIHRFGESILHHFAHQRMVGDAHLAIEIFRARGCIRKNGREQIVGAHALNLRRRLSCRPENGEVTERGLRPSASAR